MRYPKIYTFLYQAIVPPIKGRGEPRDAGMSGCLALDAIARVHHGQTCRIKSMALRQTRIVFEDGQELDVHEWEIRPAAAV